MKIIKNYFYNIGYQLFIMILPLITVPYISRILGSTGVGINAYTSSIVQYFILAGSIGINFYGNRTIAYFRDDKEKLSQTFWEIVILRLIFVGISYSFFILFLFLIDAYQEYYLYQSIAIIAAGLDISWFFMGIEDFKKTVVRNVIVKIISLILIFSLVNDISDLGVYILILGGSTFIGNITLWSYIRGLINKPREKLNLIKHLKPSISLFIPQVATQIYLVLNKTMLGYIEGVQSAGYYENSDKLVKIILAIVTATGTVMLPRIANIYANGDSKKVNDYLYISLDFVSSIAFPLSLGLAAIAPKFSIWFFGQEFAMTGNIIVILSLVIILIGWSNVLGTQYLLPTNQTKHFTISVVTGAIVNLFSNIFLIKLFGVLGAAIATVISEMSVTIIQLYFVRKSLDLSQIFFQKWKYLFSSLIMFIVVRWIHISTPPNIIFFSIQVIVGIFIYFLLLWILKAPIIYRVIDILQKNNLLKF